MQEVCYERLRPKELREAREACPVAYLPIGTLEWHGFHNPVGLDTLKAHALCVRAAQKGGGLVFPHLYYGESREEGMMEACSGDRAKIAEGYGLQPSNFDPGHMRVSPAEQYFFYQRLLLHIMNEIQSLGFRVIVLCAGHYPLLDHARAAASLFHQQRWGNQRGIAIPWVFTGFELVKDTIPWAGDHAALWETSLLMALIPGLVDLSQLPKDPSEKLYGVAGSDPRNATAEMGEKFVQAIVDKVLVQANDRLKDPGKYRGHGLIL